MPVELSAARAVFRQSIFLQSRSPQSPFSNETLMITPVHKPPPCENRGCDFQALCTTAGKSLEVPVREPAFSPFMMKEDLSSRNFHPLVNGGSKKIRISILI
jgi:hypothetical protein